ncbi:putative ferric-chelate reductase 1 homolog isoform X2 [Hermetia illucens]|nr:putative ferric-chelate reductase 1 homolog isoform X2 [Hermetia illucens]
MKWKSRFFVLVVISLWSLSDTLPNGAPEDVCDSMVPFHGGGSILPMTTPPPFQIESAPSVGLGHTLKVFVASYPRELTFAGFMIQARNRDPPYQVLGQFNPVPEGLTKVINCFGQQTTATHANTKPKQDFYLEWQAPLDFQGQIVFNATIAQTYDQFWVGIISEPVDVLINHTSVFASSTTRPPLTSTTPVYVPEMSSKPLQSDPIYEGCGSVKTCFGLPDNCVNDQSCRIITAVTVKGDRFEFEVQSGFGQPGYVAVGLSTDNKMGDDSIIECVPQGGKVNAFTSWTSGNPNYGDSREGINQNIIRLLASSHKDGVIYCKVERDPVTEVKGRTFDLIKQRYHLLLAAGAEVRENGVGYHTLGRIPSAQPINLSVVQNLAGASTLLLRLHGAFMVTAWIGTTSLGILLARYFKQTWVGSQLCGKDQWFAWHRMCMVLTWSLTMAAFVIIFVEIGGWSSARNPHAILGVITTAICFFQPIGALFRPAPNARTRPYFNWGHWFGGNLAHILAIVTIFFAVKLTKAELPEWFDWILVAYVAFHVFMHLVFSIAGCASDRRATQRINSFPMSDMSPGRNNMKMDRKQDAPFAKLRKALLGIYIVILVLFVVALVVIVVLAPIEDSVKSIKSKIMSN